MMDPRVFLLTRVNRGRTKEIPTHLLLKFHHFKDPMTEMIDKEHPVA